MSIKTWKAEFYPITANRASKADAAEHSLRKWTGLLKKNLKKHNLENSWGMLVEEGKASCFPIDTTTCALCRRFYNFDEFDEKHECGDCPLFKVRGDVRCDDPLKSEDYSPFTHFSNTSDPKPMIHWLKKAVAYEKKKEVR